MYRYTTLPLGSYEDMGERYYIEVWVDTDPDGVEHFQPQTHAKEFELDLIRTSIKDDEETVKIITHEGSPNGWYETRHYLPSEDDRPQRQRLPAGWDFKTSRKFLQIHWEDFAFAYRHYREAERLPPLK